MTKFSALFSCGCINFKGFWASIFRDVQYIDYFFYWVTLTSKDWWSMSTSPGILTASWFYFRCVHFYLYLIPSLEALRFPFITFTDDPFAYLYAGFLCVCVCVFVCVWWGVCSSYWVFPRSRTDRGLFTWNENMKNLHEK